MNFYVAKKNAGGAVEFVTPVKELSDFSAAVCQAEELQKANPGEHSHLVLRIASETVTVVARTTTFF